MENNKFNKILFALFLSTISLSSLAHDSAHVIIKGKLIPKTCTVSLSNNNLDLGSLKLKDLNHRKEGEVFNDRILITDVEVYNNAPQVELVIACDSLVSVGFSVTDNYFNHDMELFLSSLTSRLEKSENYSKPFALKSLSGLKRFSKLGGYFFETVNPSAASLLSPSSSSASMSTSIKLQPVGIKDASNRSMFTDNMINPSIFSRYFTLMNNDLAYKSNYFSVGLKPIIFLHYSGIDNDVSDEIIFEGSSTFTIFYI